MPEIVVNVNGLFFLHISLFLIIILVIVENCFKKNDKDLEVTKYIRYLEPPTRKRTIKGIRQHFKEEQERDKEREREHYASEHERIEKIKKTTEQFNSHVTLNNYYEDNFYWDR
jgi:hypothetical protein